MEEGSCKDIVGKWSRLVAVIAIDLGTAGKPLIQKIRIQQELVDLLNKLPVCMGVGIREVTSSIEEFYGILSRSLISIRSVDLEVIAHIAGWQLRGFSMKSMGVQALGTILNRCVGVGEGKWGQKWEYISRSLKVYALGNLRVIYGSMIVLMGVIIRDFFPDPDVVCRQLR